MNIKSTFLFLIAIISIASLPIKGFGQNDSIVYLHRNRAMGILTKLHLYDNGTFICHCIWDLGHNILTGNYQIRNDSILVLDSKQQRYQGGMLPLKYTKKKEYNKKRTIRVNDPLGRKTECILYVICGTDTIDYDIGEKWTIKRPFDSFFVERGYRSPIYKNEPNVTSYKVVFDTTHCFNDEHWIIHDDYIKTDKNGVLNGITLRKQDDNTQVPYSK